MRPTGGGGVNRLRAALAGALYSLAGRVDAPARCSVAGGMDIGDERGWVSDESMLSATWQAHLRDTTPVAASFQPGKFAYSALYIGHHGGADATLFLTRAVTRKLLRVLREVDELYNRHGENRP